MTSNKITSAQRTKIAQRLAQLPASKKAIFRQTLEKEGIDPWQLPIVSTGASAKNFPLSNSQQRLWFIEQMEAGNPMYNEFFSLRFTGDLQIGALTNAINSIIKRHTILRTNYVNVDGEGRQCVHDFEPITLKQVSLPNNENYQDALHQMMQAEAVRPFNLSSDPHMIRASLVTQEEDTKDQQKETIGLFTVHHIAFDALSIVNFMQELDKEYRRHNSSKDGSAVVSNLAMSNSSHEKNEQSDTENSSEIVQLQYSDYAQWQREWESSNERQRQADYWQKQLGDAPATLDIATQYKRPDVMTYEGNVVDIALPVSLSKQISSLAKQQNATLYMVMLAVFNILLSRYSRQDDICIGTSISNRPGVELEELIGFFVNTLVMRNQIDAQESFSTFLAGVNDTAIGAYSHKELPFDQLLTLLEIEREQNTTPLFQTLFVLNNALDELSLDLDGVDVSIYPTKQQFSRFDLSLRVTESTTVSGVNGLSCEMEFNTALYSKEMIEDMLGQYQYLLEQIVSNPNVLIEKLSLLSVDQIESSVGMTNEASDNASKLLTENECSEKRDFEDKSTTIHKQFEHWASETPDSIALVFEQQKFSYSELNKEANCLANALIDQGVNVKKPIGILLERSSDFIVSMLGILKAGAAYVPLDYHWPSDRLEQIIFDCELSTIITSDSLQSNVSSFSQQLILIDKFSQKYPNRDSSNQECLDASTLNPSVDVNQSDSAYLIYTSGSTGTPKGVVIEHQQLLHYVRAIDARLKLSGSSFALISSMAADLGNTSIYGALCAGGTLHVLSEDCGADANQLNDYFNNYTIDALKIVPSHLQGLLAALEPEQRSNVLPKKCLIVGGEACPTSLVKQVKQLVPGCRIVNHYGPTETTVGALTHEFDPAQQDSNLFNSNLPIGKPLPGNKVYIVDQCGQLCPMGVPGELWISGGGVARGYLKREQLTDEQFVANPFLSNKTEYEQHARCYKTGDKVRCLKNGEIEFLGRLDEQVKIRGYRVELGEVESVIRATKGVQQAVVITVLNELKKNQLAAYIVLENDGDIDAITKQLQTSLSNYMVPQWVLAIEKIPVTRNGKVDRKALPSPQSLLNDGDSKSGGGKEPKDEKEQQLAAIWSEILGLEKIYTDADFFELGGDSILSLQVIAKAKRAGLKLLPKQLFEHKTIEALAKVAMPIVTDKPIIDKEIMGDVVITPIQDWFFTSQHSHKHHWNQSMVLQAKGEINSQALSKAVSCLVHHHDQLRCTYLFDGEQATSQQVLPWDQTSGEQYYVNEPLSNDFIAQINHWQGSLSFEAKNNVGQLFKLVHFAANDNEKDQVLLVAHHLLVDGITWRVLIEDLLIAYQHALNNDVTQPVLSNKTLSFKAWSEMLRKAASQTNSQWQRESRAYWQNMKQEINANSVLLMPDSKHVLSETQECKVKLDVSHTKALLTSAPKAYKTKINDLLLSALSLAIKKQLVNEPLYIELEGHGREALDRSFESLDVSRTAGWFTSRFPLLLNSFDKSDGNSDGDNIKNLIQSVKEQLRAVPSNGMPYGVLTRMSDMELLPKPAISFNYLGQVDVDQKNVNAEFELITDLDGVIDRYGENNVTHSLSINAMVVNGELNVHLQSVDAICNLDVAAFAKDLLLELENIIEHCGNQSIANTPSDFPLANISQKQLNDLTEQVGFEQLEDVYGLTSLQEGILFHTLMAGDTDQQKDSAYFNQLLVNVEGSFEHDVFINAWQLMLQRQTILRSSFWPNSANEPVQVVHRHSVLPVSLVDLRTSNANQQESAVEMLMAEDRAIGFDLQQAPLMRLCLIQLGENRWQVLWSRHHLLLDGWSSSRLMQEVMVSYQAIIQDVNPSAHPLLSNTPTPFSHYIAWLQQQDYSNAETFWKQYFQGMPSASALPVERDESGHQTTHSYLSAELSQQLEAIAKQQKVTLNTLIQAAWGILLMCYSDHQDGDSNVVFGMTSSGRSTGMTNVEKMLGLFINTLPVRVQFDAQQSVGVFLNNMQLNQADVREYEHVSLPQIQTWSGVENAQSLFETLLVFENYFVDEQAKDLLKEGQQDNNALTISTENSHEPTNYPITLVILPNVVLPNSEQGIELRFATHNIAERDLTRFIEHYQSILTRLANADATTPLRDLMPLPGKQLNIITEQWNDTATELSALSVEAQFSQCALQQPNKVAVTHADYSLSYEQLEAQSNQLAHALQARGIGAGNSNESRQLVGIVQHRSTSMLVSILAVMKAGAAYVPIDPNYPKDRVHYMLDHSKLTLVLADNKVINGQGDNGLLGTFDKPAFDIFNVDDKSMIESLPTTLPKHDAHDSDLAYVIYTSGSTGKPKGVQITRTNLANFIMGMAQQLKPTAQDVLLAVTSLSFDIAALELYLPLVCGAQVVIADEQLSMDGERLKNTIEQGISIMQATPVTWKLLLGSGWQHDESKSQFTALCGGEAFPLELANALLKQPIQVWNLYGPTETTVWSAAYDLRSNSSVINTSVPIGKPIANTQLYVLDQYLNPVPVGVSGELYIGGAGVALGYLHSPELSSERFIHSERFGRIYQTGDLARYAQEGVLECLGRIDNQVKVRGYRIELGEVEQCLLQHSKVVDAAVNPVTMTGEPVLVAYVVLDGNYDAEQQTEIFAEIKEQSSQQLPGYMLPTMSLSLDALPLTPNGKIDRNVLPVPNSSDAQLTQYEAPVTDIEKVLCDTWQDILGLERVGINDNFFELGGHSLLVMRLKTKIGDQFNIQLSLQQMFASQTVKLLAEIIDQSSEQVTDSDLGWMNDLIDDLEN